MNREIKFRGKRTEDGEWIYGYYFTTPLTAEYNIEPDNGAYFDSGRSVCRHVISNENGVVFEIIPETVGQYTGLCDKNGKEIYEGDIVKVRRENSYNNEAVEFRQGAFVAGYHYGSSTAKKPKLIVKCMVEIIGNIHDSPKLLTEKRK
jgi:uncharacterized phage protein (TIGR01671 family)